MTDIVQCIGCGLCAYINPNKKLKYCVETGTFNPLGEELIEIDHPCPTTIDYKQLYTTYYDIETYPGQLGVVNRVSIAYANNESVRNLGASGGVTTSVLIYLLEANIVDAVIMAFQPEGEDFASVRPIIVSDPSEIAQYSGSVYTTVPMLSILGQLDEEKKYAMTLVPEQAATLRKLQHRGDRKAAAVKFVAGLMTGTTLRSSSIDFLLRREKATPKDITSFKWRFGQWPGALRIELADGRAIHQEKVYYNFLIPSFIAPHSLGSHDFYNEFADIVVGDAWDDDLEKRKSGISLLLVRTNIGAETVNSLICNKILCVQDVEHEHAKRMHAHMYEFKKRGSFIRTKILKIKSIPIFRNGYVIDKINRKRIIVEKILSIIFYIARSNLYLLILRFLPMRIIGPVFNFLRLRWKKETVKIKRNTKVSVKW